MYTLFTFLSPQIWNFATQFFFFQFLHLLSPFLYFFFFMIAPYNQIPLTSLKRFWNALFCNIFISFQSSFLIKLILRTFFFGHILVSSSKNVRNKPFPQFLFHFTPFLADFMVPSSVLLTLQLPTFTFPKCTLFFLRFWTISIIPF